MWINKKGSIKNSGCFSIPILAQGLMSFLGTGTSRPRVPAEELRGGRWGPALRHPTIFRAWSWAAEALLGIQTEVVQSRQILWKELEEVNTVCFTGARLHLLSLQRYTCPLYNPYGIHSWQPSQPASLDSPTCTPYTQSSYFFGGAQQMFHT